MNKTANVKSLKDYAAFKGVAYETVRRQVLKYEAELSGHISIQGRTRYLDDYAMQFLDNKQQVKVVTVFEETGNDIKIAELEKIIADQKDEILYLHRKMDLKRDELDRINAAYIQLQKEYQALTDKQREVVADPVQTAAVHPDESKEEEKRETSSQEEPEKAQNSSDTPQNVPDQEEIEADKEEKERVNIDTLSGTDTHDNTAHERESVADPVQTAAVPEEKREENAVSDRSSAPDQEQEKQSQKNTGLLHRLFSFWKR